MLVVYEFVFGFCLFCVGVFVVGCWCGVYFVDGYVVGLFVYLYCLVGVGYLFDGYVGFLGFVGGWFIGCGGVVLLCVVFFIW